ncbi:polymorphic toxin-type HINT domain-containing protein [Streptomyces sp. NPDC006288]|uniref:polymorphic toxin-type HINT domain-containing protein n=1 Tax=Streptomyces sp. NPDC006288 TaxID=3156743 RepID=UPI0033A16216
MSRNGARRWAGLLAAAVVVGLLPANGIATAADSSGVGPRKLKQPPTVAVKEMAVGRTNNRPDASHKSWKTPKVSWPKAASATVNVTAGASPKAAGTLPISLGAPASKGHLVPAKTSAKVTLVSRDVSRKAGVAGLMFSVARTDIEAAASPTSVKVDYSAIRGAYGGDWASRLRLMQMPACAVTTPDKPECRVGKPLPTTNDTEHGILAAATSLPASSEAAGGSRSATTSQTAVVFAASAAPTGPTGTYKASSLQASGSWTAGGSTGGFSWSYPISSPPVPGGLEPKISLGYNSQAVDGRTSASNNQSSWLGDGWDWEPGYVERRYKACDDDKDKAGATNTARVGDLCWYNDNAILSLGGKTTELVYQDGKGWHPASDSGEKVEKLTGASNGDGGTTGVDGKGEHWKVTATDGTQYFFGLNHWGADKSGDPVTNSTWTVPVFGNHSGEPCYNAAFASAWCQQAWRWQLDFVVDPLGNAMAYYWDKESNNYGRNVNPTTGKATVTPYTRGGTLNHIDYGLRGDAMYTTKAVGQVAFTPAERCLESCGTFDETNAKNWPDVPFDQYCKDAATECKSQFSPTFWSRERLATITTKIYSGGAYKDVDTWNLVHGFPPAGDGISTPMWLSSIQHTGKAGGTADSDPVTFRGEQKANRVDKLNDNLAPFIRLRMSQIVTETGGSIGVTYYDPDCSATALPPTDGTNSTRCYSTKSPITSSTSERDWFNTYPVKQVIEDDNFADTPNMVTEYSYLGGAKWAKSDSEFTKTEDRTYSIARGYERVQTRTGQAPDPRTLIETRYFRGIEGAQVENSADVAVADHDQFAGMVRETATYNGDGGALVSATSYTPWTSAATATRSREDAPALTAYLTGTKSEETRTTTSKGVTTTKSGRDFDSYGMVNQVTNYGDTAVDGDEQCTTTGRVRNTNAWILHKVSSMVTIAAPCGEAASPANIIDAVRTSYDNQAYNAAPTRGLVTKTERINAKGTAYEVASSTPSLCGVSKQELCYDQYGRLLATANAYGNVSWQFYTPPVGGPVTEIAATNELDDTTRATLDPLRGQPLKSTDANGKITSTTYDALGRTTAVWLPTRSADKYPAAPNLSYSYQVRKNTPVVVTTKALDHNSNYQSSYTIYDGLLRPRQTQEKSPDQSGSLVSETFYNSRGEAWRDSGVYYTSTAPSTTPVTGTDTLYPASTETVFDGAGRPTTLIARKFTDETKRTTTSYTGDTTTVVPPKGGIATTAVVDALGRTVEAKQYTDAARTTSQSVKYAYNKLGRLEKVTDPSGAEWTYTYDVRGRTTDTTDPDKGATHTEYDQGDRPTDVTDARNITLHTDYDELGRPTELKKGSTTLSAWTYDTVAKGQPATTTRYIDNKPFVTEVTEYDDFYQPVGTKVTIPAMGGLTTATSYEWFNWYNENTGQLEETEQPALGGVPAETLYTTYNTGGQLKTLYSGAEPLVGATTYDHYGRNTYLQYGKSGQAILTSSEYDDHTGALTRNYVDRQKAPQRLEDSRYTYDLVGNITQIASAYDQDAARTTDTQCFSLDALTRITEAWTNTGTTCASAPSAATVGGPDAYWTSYIYDAVGNRKTETEHTTASGPATDTIRTYTAPAAGKHSLPGVTQTGTNPHTENYTYTPAGDTETRLFKQGTTATLDQNLTWDDEGNLTSLANGAQTSSYTYDTAGQRLTRTDSTGTTFHLPGGNELLVDKVGKATGTRYYSVGDDTIAMRTSGKLTFLLSDHQGTGTTQVTADTEQTVTRRKSTIFGAPRGTQPTGWKSDKTFVGGTKDTDTGLTHLGAREYDPAIGRFLSVDPIMDLADAQQIHGYTYGNNNPVTNADPSGLCFDPGNGHCSPTNGHDRGATPPKYDYPDQDPSDNYGGNGRYSNPSPEGSHLADIAKRIRKESKSDKIAEQVMRQFYQKEFKPADWEDEEERIITAYAMATNTCLNNDGCPDDLSWSFFKTQKYKGLLMWGLSDGGGGLKAAYGLGRGGKKTASRPQKSGCTQCFLAGTDVLMADGSTKNIEDVKPGDEVLSTNPLTGETGPRQVTNLIITEDDKHFNELSIATGTEKEKLTATHEHPFWSPSEHQWIEARDLKAGMTLLTDDGTSVTVRANRSFSDHARTYNLTVDDLHTYYVLAGATPVLVHNSSCWTATSTKTPMRNALGHWGKHKGDYPHLKNAKQYVEDAQRFMRSQDPWIQTKVRGNGDVVRYNRATENFGIMTPSGEIRTYYKPDPNVHGYRTNQDYFDAQ